MNNFNVIDSTGNSKIPYGCMAFGVDVTSSAVDHWINTWKSLIDEMNVLLVLAGTKTAEVKGISAAGATAEARKYTAIADAELLIKGPSSPKRWPLPPLPAGVSPALISHVCSKLLGLNPVVCAIGLSQFPTCPCLKVEDPSLGPADCLSKGKAMDIKRVEMLWEKGFAMGLKLKKPLMLAECVPGGTSTALAVLTGLGIAAAELVSGSVKNTPISLKKSLVEQGLKRGGIGPHSSPKSVLAAVGDPFQAFAVVLLLGARKSETQVLLGGGSQMIAVLALALSSTDSCLRSTFIEEIAIATTPWLVNEKNSLVQSQSSFVRLIALLGEFFDVNILGLCSGLCFDNSSKKVLKDYELGYIKEGVGVGAFMLLAQIKGISCRQLIKECEIAVDQLNEKTHS